MKLSQEDFARDQKKPQPPVVREDLTGKVVVLIGGNSGLGYEAAKHLASMNPKRLIFTSRNEKSGQEALRDLKEQTKFEHAEMWLLDLNSFTSVRTFADKLSKETDRIDILIQNAGMIPGSQYVVTPDGWETSLQVNNLSSELLALLLLPKIFETAQAFSTMPRLVVVSSDVHYWITLDENVLEAPNLHEKFTDQTYCTPEVMGKRYFLSKLLNVFFIRGLNDRLSKSGPSIVVNAVNPGFALSGLRRGYTGEEAKRMSTMEQDMAFTTEEGSRHIIYGAVAGLGNPEQEKKLQGAYTSVSEIREVSDFVLSKDGQKVQDRLWSEMVDILGKVDGRVPAIVKNYLN